MFFANIEIGKFAGFWGGVYQGKNKKVRGYDSSRARNIGKAQDVRNAKTPIAPFRMTAAKLDSQSAKADSAVSGSIPSPLQMMHGNPTATGQADLKSNAT